jgi:tubulin-specific chaperone D
VEQQRHVADNLVKFAQGLPLVKDRTSTYSLSELVVDLIDHAKSNMTANAIIVPVFQTFSVLLEADVLRELPNEVSGLRRCVARGIGIVQPNTEIFSLTSLLHMSSKNIDRLKSVQRIHEAMKM